MFNNDPLARKTLHDIQGNRGTIVAPEPDPEVEKIIAKQAELDKNHAAFLKEQGDVDHAARVQRATKEKEVT